MRYLLLSLCFGVCLFSCEAEKPSEEKEVRRVEVKFRHEADISLVRDTTEVVEIQLELAKTNYQKETGLMHRTSMKPNQGMLFVYENERPRPGFYMKNTHINLDLIYLNSAFEVVDVFENAKAFDETTIPSTVPAKYVLEVNAGFVSNYSVILGDAFQFSEKSE
jgi:uncharacterized membrane protein (UPF0127 family)